VTDHGRKYDLDHDTDPGVWDGGDDSPTEVDPQTERERAEESQHVVEFFERWCRSHDLARLGARRQRELVFERHSGTRDFVVYASPPTAPPRATRDMHANASKVQVGAGMDDRTAPTLVLPSRRPARWRWGVVLFAAGLATMGAVAFSSRMQLRQQLPVRASTPPSSQPSNALLVVQESAALPAREVANGSARDKPTQRASEDRATQDISSTVARESAASAAVAKQRLTVGHVAATPDNSSGNRPSSPGFFSDW
jgi:hypothetical protein